MSKVLKQTINYELTVKWQLINILIIMNNLLVGLENVYF